MSVQNHIHLALELGDVPELAPVIKWKVIQKGYARMLRSFSSVNFGLTGELRQQVLLDTDGDPVVKTDYRYRLLVRDYDGLSFGERIDALYAMLNQIVYLVDIDHPSDGVSHTSAVREMFLAQISPIQDDHPTFAFAMVDVELLDAS